MSIDVVEGESCIHEVKKYVEKIAPKVVEKLKQRGYNVSNIKLEVKEGVIVLNNQHACAGTNPDVNPVIQLYSCTCWKHLNEPAKIFTVAHELVHAFSVKDEYLANQIALEIVRESK